jgi:hypothetical protein
MLPSQVSNINGTSKFCNDISNLELHTPFRRTVYYINNTSENIVVVHRNNLPIYVKQAAVGIVMRKDFIVRTIYKFQTHAQIVETINMVSTYQKLHGANNLDLELVREILLTAVDQNKSAHNVEVCIDLEIPAKEITKLKACYSLESDLLLMSGEYHTNIPHPYSAEGRTIQQFKDLVHEHKFSGMVIELIDNEMKVPRRFITCGKTCMEIAALQDPSRPSGVYVKTIISNKDGTVITPSSMVLDDAENKLGLYPTIEQAVSNDQIESLSKQQLQVAQNELEMLRSKNNLELEEAKKITEELRSKALDREIELSKLKQASEIDMLKQRTALFEAEAEAKRVKIEHDILKDKLSSERVAFDDMIKQKSTVRNDYYEAVSAQRKDNSEYIKLAGIAAVTGVGVWAAMRKYG